MGVFFALSVEFANRPSYLFARDRFQKADCEFQDRDGKVHRNPSSGGSGCSGVSEAHEKEACRLCIEEPREWCSEWGKDAKSVPHAALGHCRIVLGGPVGNTS